MKKHVYIVAFICVIQGLFAQNSTYQIDKDKSEISYSANHMLHSWEGVNHAMAGLLKLDAKDPINNKLAVLLHVRDFDSKNSSRDAHSLEVLDGIKYPDVRFYATNFSMEGTPYIEGKLTFHGIEKTVRINTEIERSYTGFIIKGNFSIKPSTYKIKLPSFMMVDIDDQLDFHFVVELKKVS